MTIDEAIKHAKDTANANYEMASAYHDDFGVYGKEETRCRECAEEHEQLAEWLEELKKLRLGVNYLNERAYQQGRADAIDEFARLIHEDLYQLNHHQVDFLAEQLKEQTE